MSDESPDHVGCCIAITDFEKDLFFVQQKDKAYKKYPLCYSLFGGALEPGEDPREGLERELSEELHALAVSIVKPRITYVGLVRPVYDEVKSYPVHLFEAVLLRSGLRRIAALPVSEGAGQLKTRKEMEQLPFVYGLEQAVDFYLNRGNQT